MNFLLYFLSPVQWRGGIERLSVGACQLTSVTVWMEIMNRLYTLFTAGCVYLFACLFPRLSMIIGLSGFLLVNNYGFFWQI